MTSAWDQLEQMLTCAICLDKFKNPRLLPCQHSFCGDACMEGLVDYARRQIKCPECRAEHRIPYQGIASLPSNVTLIRFLELHARITGEEPEPVPTFMEKCSVCGEKVEGVQRCSHCEKKVCPECKEAHIDLLRREINRINGQAKRCLGKMQDFKEILSRAEERLQVNRASVRQEIEESCRRLIEDLQAKQKRLIDEVDSFADFEQKTIDKLKVAIVDELNVLESNSQLADSKISTNKYQWTDIELSELKEIYARSMEFARLFDPEIGDFNRKIRFTLIPEFDTMRRRLCELGELKFSESAASLMANSLQYCNATGVVAMELCNSAAAQAAAQAANASGSTGYGLAHSNSNSNLGASMGSRADQLGASGGSSFGGMLELPNALMRSQSDHRLASQFQQRLLKQQQQQEAERAAQAASKSGSATSRYGRRNVVDPNDYDNDSSALRSRYAPPRASAANEHLLRDWPRPSDNDSDSLPFGSSIHFKSAFMRRKEKERQQFAGYGGASSYGGGGGDDDDDLVSEASYSTTAGRNVRFYDQTSDPMQQANGANGNRANQPKLFDVKEVERGPLSGTPKVEGCGHLHERLHQMGAKAVVDEKRAKEESTKDRDLVESARLAMTKAASERQKLAQRQISEDEIEKQKRQNKQAEQNHQQPLVTATPTRDENPAGDSTLRRDTHSPADFRSSSTSTVVEAEPYLSNSNSNASQQQSQAQQQQQQSSTPATPPSPGTPTNTSGGRRSLYGQAVNERSKRQLSNAIQDAATYTPGRRRSNASSIDTTSQMDSSSMDVAEPGSGAQQASATDATSNSVASPGTPCRTRRGLRSQGRSLSKQSSVEQQASMDSGSSTPVTGRRRRTLARADSSTQRSTGSASSTTTATSATNESSPKNYTTGSGGNNSDELTGNSRDSSQQQQQQQQQQQSKTSQQTTAASSTVTPRSSQLVSKYSSRATASTTTDDDDEEEDLGAYKTSTSTQYGRKSQPSTSTAASSYRRRRVLSQSSDEQDDDNDNDDRSMGITASDADRNNQGDDDEAALSPVRGRDVGPRGSREFLPQAVNRLLDRSAQIRRDSQEQRSRGNSPPNSGSSSIKSSSLSRGQSLAATGSSTGSASSSAGSALVQRSYPTAQSSFYSNAAHRRLAYQRSQSQSQSQSHPTGAQVPNDPGDETNTTNSNNSIYTTASSHQSSLSGLGRKSSAEDNSESTSSSSRRYSGHSTDRTLTGNSATGSRYRHTDSSESPGSGYQSRFLARSRTSAALYSSNDSDRPSASRTSSRDQPESDSLASRSYGLSSRDRFMQSAASPATGTSQQSSSTAGATSASATSTRSQSPTSAAGSNLYSSNNRAGTSAALFSSATMDNSRTSYQALPQRYQHDNSPFIELDDEDDQYSAYFPTGFKTHSEYLRNKFGRRTSSNSSSSSLARSRSTHSGLMTGQYSSLQYDDDGYDNYEGLHNNDKDFDNASFSATSLASDLSDDDLGFKTVRRRRSSLMSAELDGPVAGRVAVSSVYSNKGRMLFKMGSRGSDPGNFTWPRGVATGMGAMDREIVVADSSNHRVQVFDINGRFLREFGSYGSAIGQFDCLAGVAIDRLNRNYIVSDRYNHRVQIFNMSGEFVRSFGENGRDVGKFNLPWGIACDMNGSIYVCDKENHRIQVFDSDGKYLYKFGISGSEPGQLQHPHYIATSAGKIAVTDTNNHRVQLFDLNGRLIKVIGKEGSHNGQFKFPRGVALDEQGFIIVGDSGNNRLQIFNPDGLFVKAIGTWGSSDGEFKGIEGVAVDPTSNNILVCDRENHRIQVF